MAWRVRLPRVKGVRVCTYPRLGSPSCADHTHRVGTGGARPSLGRGSHLLPLELWQEGPWIQGPEALRPELPRDLGPVACAEAPLPRL